MDWININNDCDLDADGLIDFMTIRAGQPSKFKQINMVGAFYDKNGHEVVAGDFARKLEDLDDCTIANPTNNQALVYDTGLQKWENKTISVGTPALDDLTNVAISNPTNGQSLTYNTTSTKWENSTVTSGVTTLTALTDVAILDPMNDQVLTYDNGTSKWKNKVAPSGSTTLSGLSDVTVSNPTNSQVLSYNTSSTKWENTTIPSGVTTLAGLSDVAVSGMTNNASLVYNTATSKWVNVPISHKLSRWTYIGDSTDPWNDPQPGQMKSNFAANRILFHTTDMDGYDREAFLMIAKFNYNYIVMDSTSPFKNIYVVVLVSNVSTLVTMEFDPTKSTIENPALLTVGTQFLIDIDNKGILDSLNDVAISNPNHGDLLTFDGVSGAFINTPSITDITKEPTGFDNPQNVVVTYDFDTRTVSLGGSNWKAYWRGSEFNTLVPDWISEAHPDVVGNYFLYYDGDSIQWTTTPWTLDTIQIAYISYQSNYYFGLRECHGLMPWQVHVHLHRTIGTYLVSGGDFSNYTLNSTTAADRRPELSQTIVADEDLQTTNETLLKSQNNYSLFYLNGTTPTLVNNSSDIITLNGGIPRYNLDTAGTWSLADFTNNYYGKIFVLAVPTTADSISRKLRYVFITPQQINASLTTIQSVAFSSLTLGTFGSALNEYIAIGEIIIRYHGGNWTLISVSKITGTKQTLVSSAVGLTSVSTDNTTILGNGTAGSALYVAPKIVPYYYGQWQCGSVTYDVNNPPIPGAGSFYFQSTTIYPNTYELIINYTDLNTVNHTSDFEKLDYSSIIQIYSTDKTQKNRYVISQYVTINGSSRKYYLDALQSSEEFSLVMMSTYQFDLVFYPVQDIDDLRNVNITNPISSQVLTYNGTDWINKVPGKSMMTVGWYNNVPENYFVDTNYYFPFSPYGVTLSIIGTSFSQVAAINIPNMLASDLGTNKCGIKNISGGTKQFLVMGKVSGSITNQTWVGFGVNDKYAVQIRQSRSNSTCMTNDTLVTHFHCIVDIPDQDGVYIAGCTHANYDVRFNLFNIWLTVIEI